MRFRRAGLGPPVQLEGRQFPESSPNFSAASARAVFRFVHGGSRPALRGCSAMYVASKIKVFSHPEYAAKAH